MVDWWWLLVVGPVSALAGMFYTGGRWQRDWNRREREIRETAPPLIAQTLLAAGYLRTPTPEPKDIEKEQG